MTVVVAPLRWFALAVVVATALLLRAAPDRPRTATPDVAKPPNDLLWIREIAATAMRRVSFELAVTFDRLRSMAALAEYRAARAELERRAEWGGCRYERPRPRRPIHISRACLDNPLAKDCL